MRVEAKHTQRGNLITVKCHDAPITVRGKRYKKLTISCIDLWLNIHGDFDTEARDTYAPNRYELMIFKHRGKHWDEIFSIRSVDLKFDVKLMLQRLRNNQLR